MRQANRHSIGKRKSRTSAFPQIPDISLRRTAWRVISLTRDEARRIAANIAKLGARRGSRETRSYQRPSLALRGPS
jgi:hypothetical protein